MSDTQFWSVVDEVDALREKVQDHWQIPRLEADVLYHIALSSKAKRIVEVGTSYGFSGLFFANALRQTQGKLFTIDKDQAKVDASSEYFQRAGVADLVVNVHGEASRVLKDMDPHIDIAFLDADKESTLEYFRLLWPKMNSTGSVLIDNALTHEEELAETFETIRSRDDTTYCDIPVGNGLAWFIKA